MTDVNVSSFHGLVSISNNTSNALLNLYKYIEIDDQYVIPSSSIKYLYSNLVKLKNAYTKNNIKELVELIATLQTYLEYLLSRDTESFYICRISITELDIDYIRRKMMNPNYNLEVVFSFTEINKGCIGKLIFNY